MSDVMKRGAGLLEMAVSRFMSSDSVWECGISGVQHLEESFQQRHIYEVFYLALTQSESM